MTAHDDGEWRVVVFLPPSMPATPEDDHDQDDDTGDDW